MAGDLSPPPIPEVRLRDLKVGTGPVEVIGRVITWTRREVTRRSDGSRRPLVSGQLSDGTATVRFTWWDPPSEALDRGTVLRAVGAEVGEFRGRPELTFTWKTKVGPASPVELPKVDSEENPLRPLAELRASDEGFRVEVRVARMSERAVSVGEERRIVHEGLVADSSGVLALSAWSDFGLKPGETVRIAGGYVSLFRGRAQLVLDERTTVVRIDRPDLPDPARLLRAPPRPIADIEDDGGGAVVALEGLVVGLSPPSGLVYRCPTCRRGVSSGLCRVHGSVEGTPDLRARIVLDDGTGSATVSADREFTERLWGVTLPEVLRRLKDQPDPTLISEALVESLFGRRLRVRGSATRDDFGLTVVPESIEPVEIDLAVTADELSARLGGRG
ncbi:MAG: hypothetical protein WBG19_08090 [Thermoplasmata archaeon]